MARSMLFEENDDGTTLATYTDGDMVHCFLLPLTFADFSTMIPQDVRNEVEDNMRANLVHIPNSLGD